MRKELVSLLLFCTGCSSTDEVRSLRTFYGFSIGDIDPEALTRRAHDSRGNPCICGDLCAPNDSNRDNGSATFYTAATIDGSCRMLGYRAWTVRERVPRAVELFPNAPESVEAVRARYGSPTYLINGPKWPHANEVAISYCRRLDGHVLSQEEAALNSGEVFLYSFAFNDGDLMEVVVGNWSCVGDPFLPMSD